METVIEQEASAILERYEKQIQTLYTTGKQLTINWADIYDVSEDLGEHIITDPRPPLNILSYTAHQKLKLTHPEYAETLWDENLKTTKIHISIKDLPIETPIRKIDPEQMGQLIQISGITVKATTPKSLLKDAVWVCRECGAENHEPQKIGFLIQPDKCFGCSGKKFYLLGEKCVSASYQEITIQERPEDLPPGQMPRAFTVRLEGVLTGIVNPGDRVALTGILSQAMTSYNSKSLLMDMFIDGNYIDLSDTELGIVNLTEEDIETIKELSRRPAIIPLLVDSIAPDIYGYNSIKEAMLYQQMEGITLKKGAITTRGLIHILLVGDPGIGKSQLLRYAASIAPRGIFTTGKGASGVGLTASAVKEDDTWVLEAGSLVIADKGICCIDEIEKMNEVDRTAIHPAMEQLVVTIAKAGINKELPSRTSILAAANPTFGRYNPYVNVAENIKKLPVTLLSRFDLIYILKDTPDRERDDKILDITLSDTPITPPISPEIIRKYISYARTITPTLTPEAAETIRAFYHKMRKASKEGGEDAAIAITTRQSESLRRIAQARARCRLSNKVTLEDAEAAVTLTLDSLNQVGIDPETGEIDIDLLYSGKPRSLQAKLQRTLQVIGDMQQTRGSVRDDDLYEALQEGQGIGRSEAARIIGVLMKDGTIYSPRPGYYKCTN